MTRRTINIISLYFLFATITFGQNLGIIRIIGAKNFSEKDYLSWIKSESGAKFTSSTKDSISARIGKGLTAHGYFDAEITDFSTSFSPDSQLVDITISINENTQTYFGEIFLASKDSIFAESITSTYSYLENAPFSQDETEGIIAETLDRLENSGYPFAKVIIKSLHFYSSANKPDDKFVDLYLAIEMETSSIIDSIRIEGNTATKDYVVLRNISTKEGDEYSQSAIDEIPKQLNKLRFFEPVQPPSFFFDSKNRGTLLIKVKEKETNNFDGIVGYVPGNDKKNGFFTGYVNISLRNLFGTGRAMLLKWQKEDRESQELELRYMEPWVFSYPFNVNFGMYQRIQDTTYVQRDFSAELEYMATNDISAKFLLESETTIPTKPDERGFTVFNSNSITTGTSLQIDTRNDFYAPTQGLYFLNSYKYSAKKIKGPKEYITPETKTNISIQHLELDFIWFYELFTRHITAAGIHARELRGSRFEISDLYKLGGTNSLRGYRENQFMGNRIFWSNLEYRYLLSKRSFAFLFFDTGYFLKNADKFSGTEEISDFKIGYGLGMNLETGLGVLNVSFALAGGDSFSEGKIHFGILNEF